MDILEKKEKVAMAALPALLEIFTKYSLYVKIRPVIALCHKFLTNLKKERKSKFDLSIEELNKAEVSILRNIKQEDLAQEIKELKPSGRSARPGRLAKLNPFIDNQELIRIGGCLRHADVTPD